MRNHELESKVLDIIGRVKARQPVEDDLVELKLEWIDEQKMARQIAAHANTALAEPILWIIGIDERNHQIVGAGETEFSNRWSQIASKFDGAAPSVLNHRGVVTDGVTVVALHLATDSPPYVVKRDDLGNMTLETPWRGATSVRSAKRSELVRMLTPVVRLPKIELLKAKLECKAGGKTPTVNFEATFFVEPLPGEPITIPSHRMRCEFPAPIGPLGRFEFRTPNDSGNSHFTKYHATFSGADRWIVTASGRFTGDLMRLRGMFDVQGRLTVEIAQSEGRALPVDFTLTRGESNEWLEQCHLPPGGLMSRWSLKR